MTATARSDAREDPDQDGLSNRFEVNRTKTAPAREDSDRDGIHDGYEDRDGDLLVQQGRAAVQDQPQQAEHRRRPTVRLVRGQRPGWHPQRARAGLRPHPELAAPKLSRATRTTCRPPCRSCHSRGTATTPRACSWTFGPRQGRKLVVLTGDSHAAHWLPALHQGGRAPGLEAHEHHQVVVPGGGRGARLRRRAGSRLQDVAPSRVGEHPGAQARPGHRLVPGLVRVPRRRTTPGARATAPGRLR